MTEWQEVKNEVREGYQFQRTGDTIEGQLKSVRVDGQYNNKFYTVETEKGDLSFFGTAVLNTRLCAVIVGDSIKVVYKGEVKGKSGRLFKDFQVFIKKKVTEEMVK